MARPAVIDVAGNARDVSAIVEDITAQTIAGGALEQLQRVDVSALPVLPAQPTMPRAAATPKELAAKAAEARRQQMMAAPKKPVSQRHGFKIGESIVYPAHGVGQLVHAGFEAAAGLLVERDDLGHRRMFLRRWLR